MSDDPIVRDTRDMTQPLAAGRRNERTFALRATFIYLVAGIAAFYPVGFVLLGLKEREAERVLLDNPDQYEADLPIWFGVMSSIVVFAAAALVLNSAGRDVGQSAQRRLFAIILGTVAAVALVAAFHISDQRV